MSTGPEEMGGTTGLCIRGSRQLSPPKPGGQLHLPLYSLQGANWPHEYIGRLQLKLPDGGPISIRNSSDQMATGHTMVDSPWGDLP